MSILSFEEIQDLSYKAKITEKTHAIDIEFQQIPQYTAGGGGCGGSGTIQVGAGGFAGDLVINAGGGGGAYINGNAVTLGYINSMATNSSSSFHTVGYRLFFDKGFLKCVKRELAYSYLVSNGTGYVVANSSPMNFNFPTNKKSYRESFYHPSSVNSQFNSSRIMEVIQQKLLSLAERKGIKVPEKFLISGPFYKAFGANSFCPALDWLTFPLIREIDSVAVAMRLTNMQRNIIAPTYNPMNFKTIVDHYYGTSTNKMLDEIWKILTIGGDTRCTHFSNELIEAGFDFTPEEIIRNGFGPIIKREGSNFYQHGDRSIQFSPFIMGPAIFKTMGFDYLYQALPLLAVEAKRPDGMLEYPFAATGIQPSLKTLLKFLAPKKLINKVCTDPDMHSLTDTTRMLDEYNSVDKIPKSLKGQYPNGLVVDFKFKTLKEMHDKVSTQYTIIKAEAAKKEIPVHPLYAKLHGMERKGLRLIVPDSSAPLAIWGKTLHICVASYGDRAAGASTLLLGVEKDGEIKYCIEFNSLMVQYIDPDSMLKTSYLVGDSIPEIDDTKILRAALPYLEERQSMVPPDVSEEEGIYQTPSMVQFRAEYNRDPSSEDRDIVENMLAQWAYENKEELNGISKIRDRHSSLHANGNYNYNIQAVMPNGMNHVIANVAI